MYIVSLQSKFRSLDFKLSTIIIYIIMPHVFFFFNFLGYCPHFNLNEARNDYNKKCLEYSYPCNCSNRYLSTEAYKCKDIVYGLFCKYIGNTFFNSPEPQTQLSLSEQICQLSVLMDVLVIIVIYSISSSFPEPLGIFNQTGHKASLGKGLSSLLK